MSDHAARLDALEDRVDDLAPRVKTAEQAIATLKADIAEVKAKLGFLATKEDVAQMGERLAAKIDGTVNGLLRDAIAAVPGQRVAWWTAAGVVVMLGSMVVSLIAVLQH